MTDVMSGLFGKTKKPKMITQPTPVEKIQQPEVEKEKLYREMAKRRRATMLSQLGEANIKRQQLGAG